uniref:Uncharacterized protein n=1 Tax=viral metagenome TaxID=1070528 RepID=A0A6C0L915_9ZZZZ
MVFSSNNILFRITKIIDIAFVAVLFFSIAYCFGYYLNVFFTNFYGLDFIKKTNAVLLLEVLSQIVCIAVVIYIGRNIVELIPSPLDGINGLVHKQLKELKSGAFFTIFIIMFQYSMQDKLALIKKRREKNEDV